MTILKEAIKAVSIHCIPSYNLPYFMCVFSARNRVQGPPDRAALLSIKFSSLFDYSLTFSLSLSLYLYLSLSLFLPIFLSFLLSYSSIILPHISLLPFHLPFPLLPPILYLPPCTSLKGLRVDFKIYQRVFAILVKSPNAAQAAVDMLLNIEKAAIITTKAILKVCIEVENLFLCITPSLPPSLFLSLFLPLILHVSIHPSLDFIH